MHTSNFETILQNRLSFFSGDRAAVGPVTISPVALVTNKRVRIVAESASELSQTTQEAENASGGLVQVESESVNLLTGEIVRVISIPDSIAVQVINKVAQAAGGSKALVAGMLPPGIEKQLRNAGANQALIDRAVALATLGFPPGLLKQVALLCLPDNTAAITSLNTFQAQRTSGLSFGDAKDAALAAGCAAPGVPLPPGLVGWWPGDGNANDISGNGNNGTLVGGTTFVSGKVAQAFSFDGVDDFVSTPFGGIAGSGPRTIDAWIKTTATGIKTIGSYGPPTPARTSFGFQQEGARLSLRINGANVFWDAPGVNDGQFHHVALTYPGGPISNTKAYMDGVLLSVSSSANPTFVVNSITTINPFKIGTFGIFEGNLIQLFDGVIDEVDIFNRVLSQAEIQSIFNAGSLGKIKP